MTRRRNKKGIGRYLTRDASVPGKGEQEKEQEKKTRNEFFSGLLLDAHIIAFLPILLSKFLTIQS